MVKLSFSNFSFDTAALCHHRALVVSLVLRRRTTVSAGDLFPSTRGRHRSAQVWPCATADRRSPPWSTATLLSSAGRK